MKQNEILSRLKEIKKELKKIVFQKEELSNIKKELQIVKKEIIRRNLYRKRQLTISEAAVVVGVSKSYIQKLTARREIPHSKPSGKLIFINRKDLEKYLSKNYIDSNENIETIVADSIIKSINI